MRASNIESTDACNLFCRACKTPHGNNFISTSNFTIVAKKLVGHAGRIALHWRGEPCLHPRLPELAQIATKLGFKPWVSTNTAVPNLSNKQYTTHLLNNLDWIELCIDGYNEDTAAKYRVGANWNQIKQNLKTISEVETNCKKVMRVLMFKYNDGKEQLYRNMAREHNIDEVIFASPLIGLEEVLTQKDVEEWLPTTKKYQRYEQRSGVWTKITRSCAPVPLVSVHGDVYPCGLDWGLNHKLGSLLTEDWHHIMRRFTKIRRKLGSQEMCKLCCLPGKQISFTEKIK